GCTGCHQLGNKATREIPAALGKFEDTIKAWDRRIQAGQAGGGMSARFTQVGRARALGMFAEWTDQIAHGKLPDTAPARPQGRELDGADGGAQLRDGRAGARLGCRANSSEPDARVLPGRLEPSVSEGRAAPAERPADAALRSEDQAGHDHRYLLRHAPPESRR